ncbi:unnamed protein product [Caenorhabditis bovis]|uniref:Uncharacterized protein n=1 Tax=Caenorhabditis bovis TaxID=2654633 RepID=A0A8S1EVC3_9PELO|nr:unnamed protein product [Caenorhabditis bovis]
MKKIQKTKGRYNGMWSSLQGRSRVEFEVNHILQAYAQVIHEANSEGEKKELIEDCREDVETFIKSETPELTLDVTNFLNQFIELECQIENLAPAERETERRRLMMCFIQDDDLQFIYSDSDSDYEITESEEEQDEESDFDEIAPKCTVKKDSEKVDCEQVDKENRKDARKLMTIKEIGESEIEQNIKGKPKRKPCKELVKNGSRDRTGSEHNDSLVEVCRGEIENLEIDRQELSDSYQILVESEDDETYYCELATSEDEEHLGKSDAEKYEIKKSKEVCTYQTYDISKLVRGSENEDPMKIFKKITSAFNAQFTFPMADDADRNLEMIYEEVKRTRRELFLRLPMEHAARFTVNMIIYRSVEVIIENRESSVELLRACFRDIDVFLNHFNPTFVLDHSELIRSYRLFMRLAEQHTNEPALLRKIRMNVLLLTMSGDYLWEELERRRNNENLINRAENLLQQYEQMENVEDDI